MNGEMLQEQQQQQVGGGVSSLRETASAQNGRAPVVPMLRAGRLSKETS